jgi:hypothetical protein
MPLLYSTLHTIMIQIEYNTNSVCVREYMICMRGEDLPTWSSILFSFLYFFSIFFVLPSITPNCTQTYTYRYDIKGADTTSMKNKKWQ